MKLEYAQEEKTKMFENFNEEVPKYSNIWC